MTSITVGLFHIDVNYLYKPKGRHTWHYRRVVPADLRQYYSTKTIIKSLKTSDDKQAAAICLELNQQYAEEFQRLRQGMPKQFPKATHTEAVDLLKRFSLFQGEPLDEHAETDMHGEFYDYLDDQLYSSLSRKEYSRYRTENTGVPAGVLSPVDQTAMELLKGQYRPKATEYLDSFLEFKHKQGDKKFVQEMQQVLKFLLKYLKDKPPGEYTRQEVRYLIQKHSEEGKLSTLSIKKRLGMLRAMFNKVALELGLGKDKQHPFIKFDIPKLGDDTTDRKDFTTEELNKLREAPPARVIELSWLIHLMLETGLRVNECCGLRKEDIFLDVDTPYLVIHRNPFRRLKTKASKRFIPLVGVALSAMKSALKANQESKWVFKHYIDEVKETTKNGSASAAANKRIRAILGNDAPTCHSLRHTLQSRLRNVGCPKEIRDELGGWSKTMSDTYGSPVDLAVKQDYLIKSISAESGVIL